MSSHPQLAFPERALRLNKRPSGKEVSHARPRERATATRRLFLVRAGGIIPNDGLRLVGGCGIFLLTDCDWSADAAYSY
eukprot:7316921-Pyramimonas_sp.AAC.1